MEQHSQETRLVLPCIAANYGKLLVITQTSLVNYSLALKLNPDYTCVVFKVGSTFYVTKHRGKKVTLTACPPGPE